MENTMSIEKKKPLISNATNVFRIYAFGRILRSAIEYAYTAIKISDSRETYDTDEWTIRERIYEDTDNFQAGIGFAYRILNEHNNKYKIDKDAIKEGIVCGYELSQDASDDNILIKNILKSVMDKIGEREINISKLEHETAIELENYRVIDKCIKEGIILGFKNARENNYLITKDILIENILESIESAFSEYLEKDIKNLIELKKECA
jgi:hypothetical protein